MVLRLQYLKYQIKGVNLLPYFLDCYKDQALAQRLIDYFETNIMKLKRSIDLDEPLLWAPDNRIVRALLATLMGRFYTFAPQKIEDLLNESQLQELRRRGITTLEDFRLWYWQFIQDKYGGYILRDMYNEVITQVAEILKIVPEKVKPLLSAHRDEQMILHRNNGKPSAADLIGGYNYEVLETLLYNSDMVTLVISGSSLGAAARSLLKHTKRYGVLVDLESLNEALHVSIAGPRLFFGRASSFGWNIAQVITSLLQQAPSLSIQIDSISIDLILRDRSYIVQLDIGSLPKLIPRGLDREGEGVLDSKVERQFYWSWHTNKFRGWDIIHEPEAFIFGRHLIIPDFALVKGAHRVLLEIIGYWREEYTQKKRAQLELLKQQGMKHMILLVDAKHKRYFTNSIYPVVFYRARGSRYEIPYGKILNVLPK